MAETQATAFWQATAQVRATLPAVVFITSIDDPYRGQIGGRVFVADRHIAAQRIVERSHRLSTTEEIEQEKRDDKERSRQCAEIEFRRRMEKNAPLIHMSREEAVEYGALPGPAPNGETKKGAK